MTVYTALYGELAGNLKHGIPIAIGYGLSSTLYNYLRSPDSEWVFNRYGDQINAIVEWANRKPITNIPPKSDKRTQPSGVNEFYRQVKAFKDNNAKMVSRNDEKFGAPLVSNALPDVVMVQEAKVPNKKLLHSAVNMGAGVEEVSLGPKGSKARETRRTAERDQLRLLEQAIAFGEATNLPGPAAFNFPERIQTYTWNTSCTFSVGWGDSIQGRAGYSIQAPYWPDMARQLRNNTGIGTTFINSNTEKVAILEATAEYHVKCNTVDPARITIWKLTPKRDLIGVRFDGDGYGISWFPQSAVAEDPAATINSWGLFRYQDESAAGATAPTPATVPTFDAHTGLGTEISPTAYTNHFPRCMQRSFNSTNVTSSSLGSNSIWDHKDYFNSPYDFKCFTENFDIDIEYDRAMNPGDKTIIKTAIPNSFQVGHFLNNIGDPRPNAETDAIPDEEYYAWRKKYGPLYLWRIRGEVMYDSAEVTIAPSTPKQHINFGGALCDIVAHYEAHACMVPYPEEFYNYRSMNSIGMAAMDPMAFANEAHVAYVEPAEVKM